VLLASTKIELNNEYKSESKSNTGSTLLLYNSSPPILLPINSPLPYNISCYNLNLEQIVQQQQE